MADDTQGTTDGVDVDVRMIPVNRIEANEWNPNEMEAEVFEVLVSNIKEDGNMNQPVLVRKHPKKEGYYQCVDGEHRWKGASVAGLTEIMCIVVEVDEERAKLRTLSMNAVRGKNVPLKLAKIIASLQDRFTLAQIAAMTGVKKEEQETVLKLLQVPQFKSDTGVHLSTPQTAKPTEAHIMLMPEDHGPYTAAMKKAMRLAGEAVTVLIGNEVADYNKAMSTAMGMAGMKMRNVALATICQAFNDMSEEDKSKAVARMRQTIIDKRASDAEQKGTQADKSDKVVRTRVRPVPVTPGTQANDPKAKDIAVKIENATKE